MPSKLINFDTFFSTYLVDPSNTATSRKNAYECQFVLPSGGFRNVRRINLKSAEIPINFGQTRGAMITASSAGLFQIILNGTMYSMSFSNRTYTSIAAFITDFNTAYLNIAHDSGCLGGLSLYTSNGASGNNFSLIFTLGGPATVEFVDGPLSTGIMGFRSAYDSATGKVFNASGNYNLNPDNYLSMYISNLPVCSVNCNGKNSTFKIPLNAPYNSIMYYNDTANGFKQYVGMPPSFVIDRINVVVYDRWGYNINPYGADYSFTLEFEYDSEY
jgi:hypothetical protein